MALRAQSANNAGSLCDARRFIAPYHLSLEALTAMAQLLHIEEPQRARASRPQWRASFELAFRPLYPLACAWAAISVAIWVFAPHWLVGQMPGIAWHAHEMLWGFVASIAVAFLLTAGATWTGINPLQGPALAATVVLWLIARLGFLLPGATWFRVASVADVLFFVVAAAAMARVVHRSDSRRNMGVAPMLLLLGGTDAAYLWSVSAGNYAAWTHQLQLGMVGMAMLTVLVARRVIPFFANRAVPQLNAPPLAGLGRLQLVAIGVTIVSLLMDWLGLAAAMLALTAAFVLVQVLAWKPWRVWRVPLLWILYLGYTGLGAGLLMAALYWTERVTGLPLPMHVLAMAGFSLLIIGMVTRTALGHTGRPLRTDASMLASYALLVLATVTRLLALHPAFGRPWLLASAACWCAALAIYVWRFVPMLIRPRLDQASGSAVKIPVRVTNR